MFKDTSQLHEYEYTDSELNSFINEAYRLFLQETEILKKTDTIEIVNGVGILPDGVISINRVEINGMPIDRISRDLKSGENPA